MNTLKNIVLAATAAVLLGGSAFSAQPGVKAQIPFDFAIANCTLPAGEYVLKPANPDGTMITLLNLDTNKSIMVLMQKGFPGHVTKTDASGVLRFHRYGERYFFAALWTEGDTLSRHVSPSKNEREYRLTNPNVDMALSNVPLEASR